MPLFLLLLLIRRVTFTAALAAAAATTTSTAPTPPTRVATSGFQTSGQSVAAVDSVQDPGELLHTDEANF